MNDRRDHSRPAATTAVDESLHMHAANTLAQAIHVLGGPARGTERTRSLSDFGWPGRRLQPDGHAAACTTTTGTAGGAVGAASRADRRQLHRRSARGARGGAGGVHDPHDQGLRISYIDTLNRELGDVQKAFADFQSGALVRTNAVLQAHQLKEISVPATIPEQEGESGGGKEGLEALLRGVERD